MNKTNPKMQIITKLLLPASFIFTISSEALANKLPPVLDYYPKCENVTMEDVSIKGIIRFKVTKVHEGKSNYDMDPDKIAEETKKLINQLRVEASENKAKALILTSRSLIDHNSKKRNSVLLKFRGKRIYNCEDLSPNKKKLAPVNSSGVRITGQYSFKREILIQTTIDLSRKLNFPKVNNKSVSISKGVYGVNLGDSQQTVEAKLGDPSVELNTLKGEKVLGYGRNHWFHFQDSKLVKVDTKPYGLEYGSLNNVPLRIFFDDQQWMINDKYGFRTPLREIQLDLGLTRQKVIDDTIRISDGNKELVFRLLTKNDPYSEKKTYFLGGFSLALKSYKKSPSSTFNDSESQFEALNTHFSNFEKSQLLDLEELLEDLGDYAAVINISTKERFLIVNPFLMLHIKNKALNKIFIADGFLDLTKEEFNALTPWQFKGIGYGEPLSKAKSKIPDDSFEMNGVVEFEMDNYQMELRYDDIKGSGKIYAIDVSIY